MHLFMGLTFRSPSLLLVGALTALALSACSLTSTPTPVPTPTPAPTPTPLPPQAILDKANISMEEVDFFHFAMEATMKLSTEGISLDVPLSFVGDYMAPDLLRGTFAFTLLGFTIEQEIIEIGDTTFSKNPKSGEWKASTGGIGATILFGGFGDSFGGDFNDFDDLILLRQETVDGLKMYLVKGIVQAEEQGEGLEISLWVDVDDFLIRKITIEGEMTLEGEDTIDFFGEELLAENVTYSATVVFSEFRKPVSVEPPKIGENSN